MDIKQIENLLEKTQIIRNKYDDLAEYTGENFNVFKILRLDKKELMHSAFIANLLNTKGNHGQKDIFLKLFINEIKAQFSENEAKSFFFTDFNTSKSFCKEEEYIGRVDYELGLGGRIDIIVKSGHQQILIENKIGAGDQEAQLFRYYNHYKESPIIYLTPFGDEPSEGSKGQLENTKDFICISYEIHIVNWIEQCIKEIANKPIIRETLNQYLHLVKQITNQSTNDKMEKELKQLIINNKEEVKTILDAHNSLRNQVVNKVNQLYNLWSSTESQLMIKEMLNELPEVNFVIGKPFDHEGVWLFNSVFSNDRLGDVFLLEIHENENMDFSIDTGIWGQKGYESIIEEIFKSNNDYRQGKTYDLSISNEEIIQDVLKRLSFVLHSLREKI